MIGKNIQLERIKLNLTQKNIAKQLECKQSHISYVESLKKDNVFIKYIKLLRKEGADLNKLFEDSKQIEESV